ncbi:MAG TPA: hypothetical protein VEY69_09565, partial [Lautropia sp.]|nr:hypothetical protein [Lautropia sp.]
AWKAGQQDTAVTGTPLSMVPWLTRSQVEELAYFKVKTVEHLAAISDANVSSIGPIQALKQRAIDFLKAAAGAAPLEQLRAELSEKDTQIEAMKRQLKEQGDAIAELRKRGNHK